MPSFLLKTPPTLPIKAAACVAALTFSGLFVPVWAQQATSDSNAQTEMVYQLQTLLEEVRALRGQVEAQQVEIENLRKRQRDQYLDLDRRLQSLGRQALSATDESVEASPPQGLADDRAQPDGATGRPLMTALRCVQPSTPHLR